MSRALAIVRTHRPNAETAPTDERSPFDAWVMQKLVAPAKHRPNSRGPAPGALSNDTRGTKWITDNKQH